jgi:hypothetical protein
MQAIERAVGRVLRHSRFRHALPRLARMQRPTFGPPFWRGSNINNLNYKIISFENRLF